MTTSVCHGGIQTQLDPWLVSFKLVSPPPNFSLFSKSYTYETLELPQQTRTQISNNQKRISINNNGDYLGGWSFLQALSTQNSKNENNNDDNKVYVHPLVKKSKSKLSEKSLEMCTESLGSETGSSISIDSGDNELLVLKSSKIMPFSTTTLRERLLCGGASSFPPPLTTIRGGSCGGGVQVKSQREDGRLVIKAVSIETQQSCFEAERRDGRLTLCIKDDGHYDDQYDDHDDDNYDDEVYDDDVNDDDLHDFHDMEERSGNSSKNIKNNKGGEVEYSGVWCKEGRICQGQGMLNWEPFLIATS